jgi:SpoVK/Ycf46/Vps4 family AAA+-type ATPase
VARGDQLISLLRSYVEGDGDLFRSVALQIAAHEARAGHSQIATELRELIDKAELKGTVLERSAVTPIAQVRGDLAGLVSASFPETRLDSMVLSPTFEKRLRRIVLEHRRAHTLAAHGLIPRRKLLLVGPPGAGKTMTASALAGELKLPLFTVLLEGVITKYLGETAGKIRTIFEATAKTRGVFLFDEFDAIGAKRNSGNDVGEVRRVLNSFLQLLENDSSASLIICATNHRELLDRALFRRFDDVLEYSLPDEETAIRLLKARLQHRPIGEIAWGAIAELSSGLSQADIARACEEATKAAILDDRLIGTEDLLRALEERRTAALDGPRSTRGI